MSGAGKLKSAGQMLLLLVLLTLWAPAAAAPEERPKIIPLVAADSGYNENSSVNFLCTVNQGNHESLQFEWFKDGQSLEEPGAAGNGHHIEKQPDHTLLRIARVQAQHAGRYTCQAKNQFGQDSSSVNLLVNVRLQWLKEPPKEVAVSLNQELRLDCLAQGEPKPTMRWEKLEATSLRRPNSGEAKNQLAKDANGYKLLAQRQHQAGGGVLVSSGRHLSIQRARESDSGLYECVAGNGRDADLRKLVHVQVRGPPKILPIATADSYPEGSSINLICTVSGGQRQGLALSWAINGEELDHQRLKYSGLFDNLSIGSDGDADLSVLRIRNATSRNSAQYTCTAKNPLGQDSTSVKIVINVELKWSKVPQDVAVGLNQELLVECDAIGSPEPTIEWLKHGTIGERRTGSNGTSVVAQGGNLKFSRVQLKDSGLYECIAKNGVDEDLRKIIQVKVRGPPKILPIATADSYPEGSTINLICTVSGGQRKGLGLAWTKDGEELNEESIHRYSGSNLDNVSIEKTGVDISILRITNATHKNSGRFTCTAKNPLGEDSTSVNIVINVELKWNKLPMDTEIGLNQDLSIECDAISQPAPQITWTKHPTSNNRSYGEANKSIVVSQSKVLKISKAQHKDSGLYECSARNGVDQDLRRIIQIKVRGKLTKEN